LRPRLAALACVLSLLATTAVTSAQDENPLTELPPQLAYNYGETDTPRSGGMAGALRAMGGDVNAIFLNPGAMGVSRVYHIQALGQFTPEAGRQLYGGAVVDSTRRLSGGLAVVGGFQDPDGIDRSHVDVRAALAFALSNRFHLGLAGRYLSLDQEGLGPLGHSRASGGLYDEEDQPDGRDALVNTLTFDAGAVIRATDELHIGLVGQSLSYPNNGLLPTVAGGGIGYGNGDFSIEVDALADFNSWTEPSPRVMAGGELLIADAFPIRAGYRFDLMAGSGLTSSHQASGGLGYVDPRFSVEASVRRTLVGPSATMIMVGVAFHLESFGLPIEPY
jgi:opacity protein-like surface antigen